MNVPAETNMARSQRNDNFIDKSFTVMADLILKVLPTDRREHQQALEHYEQALALNAKMPQALNNIAVIYHHLGNQAEQKGESDVMDRYYSQAAEYWTRAIRLAPNNYLEAQNWLKTSGRGSIDVLI